MDAVKQGIELESEDKTLLFCAQADTKNEDLILSMKGMLENHVNDEANLLDDPEVAGIFSNEKFFKKSSSASLFPIMLEGEKPVSVKIASYRIKTSDYSSSDNSLEDVIRKSDNRNYYKEQQEFRQVKQTKNLENSLPQARFSSTMHTSTTTISKGGTNTDGRTNVADTANALITSSSTTKIMSRRAVRDSGVATSTPITIKSSEIANANVNASASVSASACAGVSASASASDPLEFSLNRKNNRLFDQQHNLLDNESLQNDINSRKEFRNVANGKSRSWLSSFSSNDSSSVSFDASRHLAYLEYKQVGEYWKKTPKTDYTYSKFSTKRRILAPGVVAMPNMSRHGLTNHIHRVGGMIERNPANRDFIRKRYMWHQNQSSSSSDNYRYIRNTPSWSTADYHEGEHDVGIVQRIISSSAYNRLLYFLRNFIPEKFDENNGVDMYIHDDIAIQRQNEVQTSETVGRGGIFARIQSFFSNEAVRTAISSILLLILLSFAFACLYLFYFCEVHEIESIFERLLDSDYLKMPDFTNTDIYRKFLKIQEQLPGIEQFYKLPGYLRLPAMPAMPAMPSMPQLPQLPQLPKLSQLTQLFTNFHLPEIDLGDYFNQDTLNAIQNGFQNCWVVLCNWSTNQYEILKTSTSNAVEQGQKLWQRLLIQYRSSA